VTTDHGQHWIRHHQITYCCRSLCETDPGLVRFVAVPDFFVVGVADTTFQLPSPRTDAWQPVGYARKLNPSLGLPRGGGFQPLARSTTVSRSGAATSEVLVAVS
jgi:hypothetical protein